MKNTQRLIYEDYIDAAEDSNGAPLSIAFKHPESFNFAFDVVDRLGESKPDSLAMLHISRDGCERRFTFGMMREASSRAACYLAELGIRRGMRVMLVLRRNWQFWPLILALHKLGAVAVPATDQLLEADYLYRFQEADISAIVATADGCAAQEIDKAAAAFPGLHTRILCGGRRDGWRDFDSEYLRAPAEYPRGEDAPCGNDPMLMYFTSGTAGYPKGALHSYTYALAHFVTARYWQRVTPDGLHFTISDTGWGKAVWGKLYGQWLCESPFLVYDFGRFRAADILPLFQRCGITTFCAPPTMYRMLLREDISQYDFSSLRHCVTAGEALTPELFLRWREATGFEVMEGYGQTESALIVANFCGSPFKEGSMGCASPLYDVRLMDGGGNIITEPGQPGEIVIRTGRDIPCGLFMGYYQENHTGDKWRDGFFHSGDTATRDVDGCFWYIGRVDDLIKSSGYRIGPFEIESIILELPYVLECGVSSAPDELRGQVVKASVVLAEGTAPTEALKAEIQRYVKTRTAPYKYPRIVVFRDSLPRTVNGKIIRSML